MTQIKVRVAPVRNDGPIPDGDPAMAASILVVYYSMTGRTRAIANEIRRATGADIEQIREPRMRQGLAGVFRALFDAIVRRSTPVLPPNRDPACYDIVIIGGPIWAGRMATPVRTFARRHVARAPQVAFFCTAGGPTADAAFADLERLCRKAPRATWLVDARHLETTAHRAELGHFITNAARDVLAKTPRHRAPVRTPQCENSTGISSADKISRVAPPRTHSRMRAWP